MSSDSYQVIDERFARLIHSSAAVEKLAGGCRWAEGPAWFAAGRYLVWSDIPNDRMLRWDETDASVSVFRQPSLHSNGHSVDREGRLVSCEHRGRCVSRTEHDGSRTLLVSQAGGLPLNSPNDVIVKSDGTVWFTDPSYGIDSDYEGDAAPSEIGGCHVYRFDPADGSVEAVITDMVMPNGLAFSPDEALLYVADTGATHQTPGPRHIRRFTVESDGRSLGGGEVFALCEHGLFDGFRVDVHGNLWTSAGADIDCLGADGTLLGRIALPETAANVCFGGPKLNRLFICATTSLYAVYLNTRGASRPRR